MTNAPLDRAYQTTINGQPVPVDSLTREQAIEALCDAYELIEDMDGQLLALTNAVDSWRNK